MKKKQKNKIIIISSIFLILALVLISANYMTKQEIIGAEPQPFIKLNYPVCLGYDGFICTSGAEYQDERTTWGNYIFLCDIDNIVQCEYGCALNYGNGNPSEGWCIDESGNPTILPDCTKDFMRCGLGSTADSSGDIYKCVDGKWKLILENDGTQTCREYSTFRAEFETEFWYCIGGNSVAGIYLSDKDSAQGKDNCYETLEEAQSNIEYCCYDPEDETYIWRTGKCIADELERSGTNIDEEWCMSQNDEGGVGSNYDKNCLIDKWWGATDPYGNYPCLIKNPLKSWWFWTLLITIIIFGIIFIYRKILLKLKIIPQVAVAGAIIIAITGLFSYIYFNGINFGLFRIGG